mmetsp:Transcript_28396/g.64957  ORF Transcript_28396/g.64957 Transcript_28396/m.64957 type:complete len:412 (-) Transcript_28396:307-1542(-)
MFLSPLRSFFWFLAAVSSFSVVVDDLLGADAAQTFDEADIWVEEIIRWVRRSGGAVSEKTEIRLPDDAAKESKLRGVYATEALEEGDIVCKIPWELIVHEPKNPAICPTTFRIYDAMRDARNPYGRFLKTQPERYLPGFWSDEGSILLREMLGGDLPPLQFDDLLNKYWVNGCSRLPRGMEIFNEDRTLTLHSLMLVLSRGDDDLMVPVYDMFNHRNGKWYNTEHVIREGKDFSIITNRKVEAGEQLYASYNQCNACQNRIDNFGTPEMFQNYGFVEPMPQRWFIEKVRVKFDIDEKEDGTGLKLTFKIPISKRGMLYFQKELHRLKNFEKRYRNNSKIASMVPKNELSALWQYHDAVITAFELAYRTGEGQTTNYVWKLGDDWWKTKSRHLDGTKEKPSSWDDEDEGIEL